MTVSAALRFVMVPNWKQWMKTISFGLCLTLIALVAPSNQAEQRIEPFRCPGIDGQTVEVGSPNSADFTVVCFLGTECPLAKLYASRLSAMAEEFAPHGVRFVGVSSNQQDSLEDLRAYAAELNVTFPIGKDYRNVIADRFAAQRTPEVFLLDRDLVVRYRGRIDDQYVPGSARPGATRQDLRLAVPCVFDHTDTPVVNG